MIFFLANDQSLFNPLRFSVLIKHKQNAMVNYLCSLLWLDTLLHMYLKNVNEKKKNSKSRLCLKIEDLRFVLLYIARVVADTCTYLGRVCL